MKSIVGWVVVAALAVSGVAQAQGACAELMRMSGKQRHDTIGPILPVFPSDPWTGGELANHRWRLTGPEAGNYVAGVDAQVVRDGRPSAFLRSEPRGLPGSASVTQKRPATELHGKRLRVGAWVRAEDLNGAGGLWMRVDRPSKPMVAFDNLRARPAGASASGEWVWSEVVLDVPPDASEVSFGLMLSNGGAAWLNGLTIEEVDPSVPTTEYGI